MRAAGGGDRPGEAPAVAVEHRQRPQVAGTRTEPCVVGHRGGLEVGTAVVVHDALGPSGRTGRVVEGEQVVLVDLHLVGGLGIRTGQPGVVLRLGNHLDAELVGQRTRTVREFAGGHEEPRTGVLEDVAHLVVAEPDVDGDEHRTACRYGVVELEHHVTVGAQRCHSVARLDAGRGQRADQSSAATGELGVGQPDITVHDGEPLGEDGCRAVEERRRRERREGEVSHAHQPAATAAAVASNWNTF